MRVLSFGTLKLTSTLASPRMTDVIIGASGTPSGTIALDSDDSLLSPTPLIAVTVHVYVLLVVRLVTVIGDATVDADPNAPPSLDPHAAVYKVIALPLSAGAVNDTTADLLPAVAVTFVGGSGTWAAGVTGSDGTDSSLTSLLVLCA